MAVRRVKRLDRVYAEAPIYFLTLNAYERKSIFANEEVHQAFVRFGEAAKDHGVSVGRYVLMLDHIHLFAAFAPETSDLSRWVKSLKNAISKCLNGQGVTGPHWQKGFFDHVLRSDESYDQKWEYVRLNPVRAGLTMHPDDWPFQGQVSEIQL